MDGVYLHIPFCASKCGYCNFCSFVAADQDVMQAYCTRMEEEMARRADEVDCIDSVYFGGGTPGVLPVPMFEKLVNAVHRFFRLAPDSEWTFETNPETVPRYAAVLRDCGINRVSLGLQATQDDLLLRAGRRHTFSEFREAADALTAAGIGNVSVDLMLGLPGQTQEHVEASIAALDEFPLKHYSVYGLKVEKKTPLFQSGYIVEDDKEADFYACAVERLAERGFGRYETSNFALPGYECRHNMKYWTLQPYLGVGVSAHSDTRGERSFHSDDFSAYMDGQSPVRKKIGIKEREEETIMLGLRMERGIDAKAFERRFGRTFRSGREEATDRLLRSGALIEDDDRIRIAPPFAYVANTILSQLL